MRESKAKICQTHRLQNFVARLRVSGHFCIVIVSAAGITYQVQSFCMIFCSVKFTTVLVSALKYQLSKPPTVMNASIEKEESSHSASKLVQTCFNVSSGKWRAIIKLHCMQSFWSFKQDRPPQTRVELIIIKRPSMQQFSLIVYHQQIVGDNNCNLMVLLYILLCKVT